MMDDGTDTCGSAVGKRGRIARVVAVTKEKENGHLDGPGKLIQMRDQPLRVM
ncbi:hypothetical protein BC567DRAFT_222555 [Phyllosticta citribraziliensis]